MNPGYMSHGPPFLTGPLEAGLPAGQNHPPTLDLLPAVIRTHDDLLAAPNVHPDGMQNFLTRDLSVERLDLISDLLWIVGWPMPPRPLHHQQVLRRSIIPSQQMDLHLVWSQGRIFVKPMPAYLMDRKFWSDHLNDSTERSRALARSARGFLRSYCALIMTECDFQIASQNSLLPDGVTWRDWKAWSREILTHCDERSCSPRWWYGELRLGRLNAIYRFRLGHLVRGYSRVVAPSSYQSFFEDNLTILAASTVYLAVVLTAMQVGLATDLQYSRVFVNASYGITVFAMISPPIVLGGLLGAFVLAFVVNWNATTRQRERRFTSLGLDVHGNASTKVMPKLGTV